MSQSPDTSGYASQADLTSGTSEFNVVAFQIQQALARLNTMTLVKVLAVTNAGGVAPVGFVDVQPMVNQINGIGTPTPRGQIFNVPYVRIQGGANAIILDPKVGDIGWCGFCDRDISSAKSTKGIANPGSRRRFDKADGVYIGGLINGVPTNYVQFEDDGTINVVSSVKVKVSAPDVIVHAVVSYAQDVNGYGQRITNTGGANYTIDNYTIGASVTTNNHPINPPEI